jgi:hypothetical protein
LQLLETARCVGGPVLVRSCGLLAVALSMCNENRKLPVLDDAVSKAFMKGL